MHEYSQWQRKNIMLLLFWLLSKQQSMEFQVASAIGISASQIVFYSKYFRYAAKNIHINCKQLGVTFQERICKLANSQLNCE